MSQIKLIHRSVDLYPGSPQERLYSLLKAAAQQTEIGISRQGQTTGRRAWPFDFEAVKEFREVNTYHSTCIETKTAATVGLGFKGEKDADGPGGDSRVSEILDPLCDISWQDVITSAVEDFWEVGNGFIEVVRDESGTISGLHHLQATRIFIYLEEIPDRHFEVLGETDYQAQKFARFGDLDSFRERFPEIENPSEIIHLRRPSSIDRYYGYPDWLAAAAGIDLSKALHQYLYDFFINRGVPEFMLFLLGQKLDKEDWDAITESLDAGIGKGKSHKSLAINLDNPEVKIQLEKLMADGKAGDAQMFSDMSNALALEIVSAHRTPPLLAGILIPGKLGATNELPNALMAFQALAIGPAQQTIQTILGCTLGRTELSGLNLSFKDFRMWTVTEEIDVGQADTVGRMREPLPEAQARGRDVGAGLLD